jgi:hypothetical protein
MGKAMFTLIGAKTGRGVVGNIVKRIQHDPKPDTARS